MATKKTSSKKSSAKKVAEKANSAVDSIQSEVTERAEKVLETLKENFQTAQNINRKIWFASLGVYGRSYDEVQARLNRTSEQGQKLINDLLARGEKVQDHAEARLQDSRATIEEQIEAVQDRFSGLVAKVDVPAPLQEIADKLQSFGKNLRKSA